MLDIEKIRKDFPILSREIYGRLQLPGDNVGMVLHRAHDDLVAFLHAALHEGRSYEVQALRCAPRKNDLAGGTGVDELPDRLAGRLVEVSGLL